MKLKINEIFYSLQGEGSASGYPFIFIRFSNCNLRCLYCDTKFSFNEGEELPVKEVTERISYLPSVDHILITGGEPLLQKEGLLELLKELFVMKKKIFIETNGSVDISFLPREIVKIIDVKTPSSGYPSSFHIENLKYLTEKDDMKFVISDKEDFDFSVRFIEEHRLINKINLIFSPVFKVLEKEKLAQWILESALPVRFSIQLHKLLKMK